jgi:hypothetical protein
VRPACRYHDAVRARVMATGSSMGLAVTALLVQQSGSSTGDAPAATIVALLAGVAASHVSRAVRGSAGPAVLTAVCVCAAGPWLLTALTLTRVPQAAVLPFAVGVGVAAVRHRAPFWRPVAAVGGAWTLIAGAATPAAAWSVDEPAPRSPAMLAGNGIVERADTHAFLIHRGAVILRHDGNIAIADFLDTPDPAGPSTPGSGAGSAPRTATYLWRMQLGARDADRRLKPQMPDHFFNWWTHSGKGLIAGPSAATSAEAQFAKAVAAWRAGDRSRAMYRLGAAVHLVDDACAPPHQFVLAPNHRAYEEWALRNQAALAVSSGGIYRDDFRVGTGHGGSAWSSDHTRGWVDECAHSAAELVLNAALPVPEHPARDGPQWRTAAHFRVAQRLTAGYIAFFFEEVGGP